MKTRLVIVAALAFVFGGVVQGATKKHVPRLAKRMLPALYDNIFEADWGGQNHDLPLPANEWTFVGDAGGDDAVTVGGEYSFLMLGTMVVTGGDQDGTLQWRIYPCGADPNNGVYAQSPPLTVHATDTISIPLVGSYPLHAVAANTGPCFTIDALTTTAMTIRGGGQSPASGGNPATVFVGIIAPYHEH